MALDIKTFVHDLRITEANKGAFLTVDDNCNVAWSQGPTETAGEVWQYNKISETCYIQLPRADLNQGLCAAILRTKNEDGKYPGILILPHATETSTNTYTFDNIQGDTNTFYYSNGWSFKDNTLTFNEETPDPYSSIIFKSVSSVKSGIETWSWVVINGVGSWSAGELTSNIYTYIKNNWDPKIITTQTAGANTLSAGLGTTDTEFCRLTGFGENLKTINSNGYSQELKPFNSNDGLRYFIGVIQENSSSTYYYSKDFDDNTICNFNLFGAIPILTNDHYSAKNLEINNISNSINALGYIYPRKKIDTGDFAIRKSANNNYGYGSSYSNNWNADKCFTYKLNELKRRQIFDSVLQLDYLGVFQIVIPIKFSNFNLDNKIITNNGIKKVYAFIQQYYETGMVYSNVEQHLYKVPLGVNDASSSKLSSNLSEVISLKSLLNGASYNNDNGTGSLIGIPINEIDNEAGGFNLVLELQGYTSFGNNAVLYDNLTDFITKANFRADCFTQIRFFGIEQLKSVNVSPEVEFECLACSNTAPYGTWTKTGLDDDNIWYSNNSFLSKDSKNNFYNSYSPQEQGGFIGGTFNGLFSTDSGSNTFFNSNGYYKPSSNVTKTVIEYNTDMPEMFDGSYHDYEVDNGALEAKLIIDWVNASYQFTGNLQIGTFSFHACKKGQFSDFSSEDKTKRTIIFYNNGKTSNKRKFIDCLEISENGLSKLPYWAGGIELGTSSRAEAWGTEFTLNITNYKTITNNNNLPPIETLCHYKCGWERAESIWTNDFNTDGSEFDGLIENPLLPNQTSPSKECIEPAHYRQISAMNFGDNNQTTKARWDASFDNTNTSLLPYLTTNSDNTLNRYWAIRPIALWSTNSSDGPDWIGINEGTDGSVSNSRVFGSFTGSENEMRINGLPLGTASAAINQFCNLKLRPSIAGTLNVDISLPFIGIHPSQLCPLVLRELWYTKTENNETRDYAIENSLTPVFDSGSMNDWIYANTRSNGNFKFTDKVVPVGTTISSHHLAYYKYYILFYMLDGGDWQNDYNPTNAIISRRSRTLSYNSEWSDFKDWFDYPKSSNNNPLQYSVSQEGHRNYTVVGLFGTTDNSASIDSAIFMEKFTKAMFGDNCTIHTKLGARTDNKLTTDKNMGSTFSFHAYVMREDLTNRKHRRLELGIDKQS